jgi:Cys-tRNA(Pro)/Cys-tRNA(Cys) deacylase
LKVGGISALALTHKNWIVFLDQPATEMQHILVSGGQRGVDLRVPVNALVTLLRARIADVSDEDSDEHEA